MITLSIQTPFMSTAWLSDVLVEGQSASVSRTYFIPADLEAALFRWRSPIITIDQRMAGEHPNLTPGRRWYFGRRQTITSCQGKGSNEKHSKLPVLPCNTFKSRSLVLEIQGSASSDKADYRQARGRQQPGLKLFDAWTIRGIHSCNSDGQKLTRSHDAGSIHAMNVPYSAAPSYASSS